MFLRVRQTEQAALFLNGLFSLLSLTGGHKLNTDIIQKLLDGSRTKTCSVQFAVVRGVGLWRGPTSSLSEFLPTAERKDIDLN